MRSLNGKVAIVTGASAPLGIGRAIALRLAKEGASVVVTDMGGGMEINGKNHLRSDLLAQLVLDIQTSNGRACAVKLDVTSAEDIETCVAKTLAEFGRLDILVNNAASQRSTEYPSVSFGNFAIDRFPCRS